MLFNQVDHWYTLEITGDLIQSPVLCLLKYFAMGKLGHLKQVFVGDHIRSFLIILGYYHLHHTFLKIKTLYQTLTKVLEISVNVSQTSVWGLQLNLLKISCVIDNNYATH